MKTMTDNELEFYMAFESFGLDLFKAVFDPYQRWDEDFFQAVKHGITFQNNYYHMGEIKLLDNNALRLIYLSKDGTWESVETENLLKRFTDKPAWENFDLCIAFRQLLNTIGEETSTPERNVRQWMLNHVSWKSSHPQEEFAKLSSEETEEFIWKKML